MASYSNPIGISPKEFGQMVRTARKAAGLTQQQLAEQVGVTKGAISQWEKGLIEQIKTGNLIHIAKALKFDENKLLVDVINGMTNAAEQRDKGKPDPPIPHHRVALIQAYGTLPPEVRRPIRTLIESLAAVFDERYAKQEERMAQASARMRKKPVKVAG